MTDALIGQVITGLGTGPETILIIGTHTTWEG